MHKIMSGLSTQVCLGGQTSIAACRPYIYGAGLTRQFNRLNHSKNGLNTLVRMGLYSFSCTRITVADFDIS